ncbi:MAG: class I SAM-dependent methyltransferase [Pseudomonadota bacterium]
MMYHEIEWTPERIKSFWDYYSMNPSKNKIYFGKMFGDAVLRVIKGKINLKGSVVDMGCGPGYFTSKLVAKNVSCIAVDSSPKSIELVNQNLGHDQNLLRTQVGDLHNMPLDDNEADVLFLMEVIEHLDASFTNQVFSELRRVIKPNGILVVTVPNE